HIPGKSGEVLGPIDVAPATERVRELVGPRLQLAPLVVVELAEVSRWFHVPGIVPFDDPGRYAASRLHFTGFNVTCRISTMAEAAFDFGLIASICRPGLSIF